MEHTLVEESGLYPVNNVIIIIIVRVFQYTTFAHLKLTNLFNYIAYSKEKKK